MNWTALNATDAGVHSGSAETFPACCTWSPGSPDSGLEPGGAHERDFFAPNMVQVAVVCVLSLTVVFGIFFMGCNLMIKSVGMINFLVTDRRYSKDVEAVVVGS